MRKLKIIKIMKNCRYNNNKRYSVFNQQTVFKFGIKQFLLLAYRNFIKGYGTKRL